MYTEHSSKSKSPPYGATVRYGILAWGFGSPLGPSPYVQLYPSLPWDLCTDSSIAKLPITASPSPTMHHLAVIAPCAPHAALRAPPALPCSSSSPYSHRNHLSRAGARPAPRPALQHFPKAVAPPPFRAPWNSGMRSQGAQLALGGRARNKWEI